MALLERWQKGDASAGNTLFNRHFKAIHRFFASKVPSQVTPDLIQETMLGCVKGAERYRAEGSFRAYLFGVARHILFGYFKKRRREKDREFNGDVTSLIDLGTSPSKAHWRQEENRLLYEGLKRLPIATQILLEMHYWEEMSTADLAVVLDVPRGTVKSRLRLARAALKKKVEEIGEAGPLLESATGDLDKWATSIRGELAAD